MSTIEIVNRGPIRHFVFSAPEHGGVMMLRGTHGVGKSTALASLQAALRGDGKMEPTDGTDRGSVSAFGVKITFTRGRTQHGGELLAQSIEGRFSLSDLIEPGIADPARADAARVKALVELSGAKADASLFDEIAPEPIVAKSDDLVTLASKAKSQWEQVARDAEAAAAISLDKAKRQSPPEGAVTTGAQSQTALQERQRKAAAKLVELQTADRIAAEAAEKHAETAKQVEAIDEAGLVRAWEGASVKQSVTMEAAKVATLKAADLREQLKAAEAAMQAAAKATADAVRDAKEARARLDDARKLKVALQASVPPRVDQAELATAASEAVDAEAALARNAEIWRNIEQLRLAGEHFATADAHHARAKKYREAAAKIDDVLSRVVQGMGCRLRVLDGRLVLDTDRGVEKFGDLSHGERTLEAIDVALAVLPVGGILVIEQETWGGLHEADKLAINVKAKARKVLVLAAEITEDEQLSAEVL